MNENKALRRALVALLGVCAVFQGQAQNDEVVNDRQSSPPTLAQLAKDADLIAMVRVEDTDYRKTREFPSSGSAWLRVLIAYRGTQRNDLIEVAEKGLHEDACYYPELGTWDFEGQRFLVFLRRDNDKAPYRGRLPGCRMAMLVTADNRYALRYPIPGVVVDAAAVETLEFSDPAAFVDATEYTQAQIKELVESYRTRPLERDALVPDRDIYVYTQGIAVSELRALMQLEQPVEE